MRMTVVLATTILITIGTTASAQQPSPGVDVRIAPGVVYQDGIFGDDDPKSASGIGAAISLQARGQTTRRTGFSFEATLQPIGLKNPHFDETLHTVYFVIGPEIGRRTYVRPVGGVALQLWSGSMAENGMNLALAAGVAVGHRRSVAAHDVGIELVAKGSCTPGACSALIGVQIPVSFR